MDGFISDESRAAAADMAALRRITPTFGGGEPLDCIQRVQEGIYFGSNPGHGAYFLTLEAYETYIPADIIGVLPVTPFFETYLQDGIKFHAFEEDCLSSLISYFVFEQKGAIAQIRNYYPIIAEYIKQIEGKALILNYVAQGKEATA